MLTSNDLSSNYEDYIFQFMIALAGNPSIVAPSEESEWPQDHSEYANFILAKAIALHSALWKEVRSCDETREENEDTEVL